MNRAALTIVLAFLVMGVADAMAPLRDRVIATYKVSELTATLLPFVVFIAFAVFSVPAGLLAGRIGKKNLLLLGLGLNAAALAVPSLTNPGYATLLACIFLLGIGTTLLQVAGNPIMRDASEEGAYSRNLSIAQGIKGLGSVSSTFLVTTAVGSIAALSTLGWRSAFPIFCGLMAVTFVLVAFLKVKETPPETPPSIGSSLALLREPIFAAAVLGIFLYVGAEQCIAGFTGSALQAVGFSESAAGTYGPTTFYLCLAIGRLLGGAMLTVVTPLNCFRLSALLGLLGTVLLMIGSRTLAIPGVVCAGLGFANIWPMLFSITVEHRPERANELSGLMCMAISGGAIVPLLMGALRDQELGSIAFIVPTVCFAYLVAISLWQPRRPAA